jgi:predicted DNA-binding transcriptional regulator AlpA
MLCSNGTDTGPAQLLTARQVSELTTLAVSTLHDYAARREAGLPSQGPPHVRLSPRCRRWARGDVLAWIEACRVSG